MTWKVNDSKIIKNLVKLDKPIRAAYSVWKRIVTNEGPIGLRNVKGFHFEKLMGTRKGEFSCRLNKGYRIFFTINKNLFTINVLEVSKHEY